MPELLPPLVVSGDTVDVDLADGVVAVEVCPGLHGCEHGTLALGHTAAAVVDQRTAGFLRVDEALDIHGQSASISNPLLEESNSGGDRVVRGMERRRVSVVSKVVATTQTTRVNSSSA